MPKIRDLTRKEWHTALEAEDASVLDRCWWNWDRNQPELHDEQPADLLPYIPPGERPFYTEALEMGYPPEEALEYSQLMESPPLRNQEEA